MSEKYNGWSNYETWNVALWLGNDQGSYNTCESLAQDAWDDTAGNRFYPQITRKEQAVLNLAKMLEDMIEEMNPLGSDASMFVDLLNAALSEVDYHEIAEHYISDLDTEEETEEETEMEESEETENTEK